jgi:hypothetical protein
MGSIMITKEQMLAFCYNENGSLKPKPECRAGLINMLILEDGLGVDEAEDFVDKCLREWNLWGNPLWKSSSKKMRKILPQRVNQRRPNIKPTNQVGFTELTAKHGGGKFLLTLARQKRGLLPRASQRTKVVLVLCARTDSSTPGSG